MAFKSIWNVFRVSAKPGVRRLNNQDPTLPLTGPVYQGNENAPPLCDELGNQWVRDASDPRAFLDPNNANLGTAGFPEAQVWERYPTVAQPDGPVYTFGVDGLAVARPSALYNVVANADTVAPSAWSAYPLYLLLTRGGTVLFSAPIPRPPESFQWTFGVKTPLNSVAAFSGGFEARCSTTRDTYTAPVGITFGVNVNWAFYSIVQG